MLSRLSITTSLKLLESKNKFYSLIKENIYIGFFPILLIIGIFFYLTSGFDIISKLYINLGDSFNNQFIYNLIFLNFILILFQTFLYSIFIKKNQLNVLNSGFSKLKIDIYFEIIPVSIFVFIIFFIVLLPLIYVYISLTNYFLGSCIYIIYILCNCLLSICIYLVQNKFYNSLKSKFNLYYKGRYALLKAILRMSFFGSEILFILILYGIGLLFYIYTENNIKYALDQIFMIIPYLILIFSLILRNLFKNLWSLFYSYPVGKLKMKIFDVLVLIVLYTIFVLINYFNLIYIGIKLDIVKGLFFIIIAYFSSYFMNIFHHNQILLLGLAIIISVFVNYFSNYNLTLFIPVILIILFLIIKYEDIS